MFGYVVLRLFFREKLTQDTDSYHFEFEDHDPGLQKYERLSRFFLRGACAGACLLFAGVFL
jgi:hypothetical protein